MDFDYTTETITPDQTSILTIGNNPSTGMGALELPSGATLTGSQPSGVVAGAVRWDSTLGLLVVNTGAAWVSFSGTVTSVNLTAGSGISVSGGPITSSGSITVNNTGVLSITGTANQVIASGATGAITLSLPQSIATTSTPTFAQVTISNAPAAQTDAVNLAALQAAIAGLEWKAEAQAATTANLTATYANGTAGVGATLTNSGTQVAFAVDGYTALLGDRILVKNQTTQTQNGIYTVTTVGSGATNWVLTRATDANTPANLDNATLYITNGTTNANSGWTQTTANPTIGTNNIVFVQFSGSGTYVAGTGLTLTGNTFSLTAPVVSTLGGTGTTTAPTSGQVLVGTSGGQYVPFSITSGTGISTTTGSGTLQINNTGVTSAIGTANQIAVSGATGAVTFSLPAAVTIGTSLTISGLTANSFVYSGTAGLLTATAAPTNGQILIGSTGAAPVLGSITAGTGITVTPGAGSITIAAINNGTVTSVALTAPSFLTVGGSPVTTSGTLALTLATQTAGTVFAGPATGGAAAPTFRALAYTDLPIKLYTENPSTPTAPSATGTNAVAIGTGSAASGTDAFGLGVGSSANLFGEFARANGSFATAGDAQAVRGVLRGITTTNATVELFLDGSGASQRLVLANNSAWTFTLRVVARRTDATGTLGSWIFNGLIYRDAAAATTTISGLSKTTIARLGSITAAQDPVVSNDTTNGSLKIAVLGVAAQTYRWVADVELTQVTN